MYNFCWCTNTHTHTPFSLIEWCSGFVRMKIESEKRYGCIKCTRLARRRTGYLSAVSRSLASKSNRQLTLNGQDALAADKQRMCPPRPMFSQMLKFNGTGWQSLLDALNEQQMPKSTQATDRTCIIVAHMYLPLELVHILCCEWLANNSPKTIRTTLLLTFVLLRHIHL